MSHHYAGEVEGGVAFGIALIGAILLFAAVFTQPWKQRRRRKRSSD